MAQIRLIKVNTR